MKTKLQDKLIKKYPKIFKRLYEKPGEILEPIYFGIECDDGWFWLLDNLLGCIQSYIDNNKIIQVQATQIKEKYGTLCFYYSGGDDYIAGMVWLAEELSSHICETCGSIENAKTRDYNGWYNTLCDKCNTKKSK